MEVQHLPVSLEKVTLSFRIELLDDEGGDLLQLSSSRLILAHGVEDGGVRRHRAKCERVLKLSSVQYRNECACEVQRRGTRTADSRSGAMADDDR